MARETGLRVLEVLPERCTGCLACELACSFHHGREFDPLKARIQVETLDEYCLGVPSVCLQCDDAPCAVACPTGALGRDPRSGAIVVEAELCNGCRVCAEACPLGALFFPPALPMALVCDLCEGEPECLRVCAREALRLVERGPATAAELRARRDARVVPVDGPDHP